MNHDLQMIAGILVGIFIAFIIFNLFFGRTMTVVLGQRFKVQAGFFKAIVLLIRDYYGGYSNTLFVRDGANVKVRVEDREMRKNRPSKTVLIFEVEI
jgi:hypothetical protein